MATSRFRTMNDMTPDEIAEVLAGVERVTPDAGASAFPSPAEPLALPEMAMVADALTEALCAHSAAEGACIDVAVALADAGIRAVSAPAKAGCPEALVVGRVAIVVRLGADRLAVIEELRGFARSGDHAGIVVVTDREFDSNLGAIVGLPVLFVRSGLGEEPSSPGAGLHPAPGSSRPTARARRQAGLSSGKGAAKVNDDRSFGERQAARILAKISRMRGIKVDFAEIENPFWTPAHEGDKTNPRRVRALRHTNESPLVMMEAKGSLTKVQVQTGHRFRVLFEKMMTGPRSIADIKERVDGGGGRVETINEDRMIAGRLLADAAAKLTPGEYWILRTVCGEGHSVRAVSTIARVRHPLAMQALRWSLNRLAELWSLASPGYAQAEDRQGKAA